MASKKSWEWALIFARFGQSPVLTFKSARPLPSFLCLTIVKVLKLLDRRIRLIRRRLAAPRAEPSGVEAPLRLELAEGTSKAACDFKWLLMIPELRNPNAQPRDQASRRSKEGLLEFEGQISSPELAVLI